MSESRNFGCGSPASSRETVCIDTYRVLDSCKDKDCFEDVRVYLTGYGQEVIERTSNIRVKSAHVVWAYIDVDSVPFNRGFYQLAIKIYVKLVIEACVCPGNIQEIEGIAVVEKRVILFGSEGSVSIFKSDVSKDPFCKPVPHFSSSKIATNMPVAVLETVDPIVLGARVVEPERQVCCCCACAADIPEGVCGCVSGSLSDGDDCNKLVVSLGFFSVVRLERPAQFLVQATEYSVPDKECIVAEEDDPCSIFRNMSFPVSEFAPPSIAITSATLPRGNCGCK